MFTYGLRNSKFRVNEATIFDDPFFQPVESSLFPARYQEALSCSIYTTAVLQVGTQWSAIKNVPTPFRGLLSSIDSPEEKLNLLLINWQLGQHMV